MIEFVQDEDAGLELITRETVGQLRGNVEKMGAYLVQMATMVNAMQRRMDEMEANQRKVTLSHAEVRSVTGIIRARAEEYCEKYELTDAGSLRAVKAAIRRDVLRRYGVKDLHDVPAIARPAVEKQITHWANIRLVMDRREKIRERGG